MPRMRCARRSGWKGSSPSVRSPVPRKVIGRPVAARMLSAAPPRASPSIFVSTRPVTGSLAWNASATRTDSWPVMASTTRSVSDGCHRAGDADELVHHRLVDVEPAGGVEDHDVDPALASLLQAGASDLERRGADRTGCGPRRRSGRRAARADPRRRGGRRRPPRAAAACRRVRRRTASFAAVVVFPEPCRPTSMRTAGRPSRRELPGAPRRGLRRAPRGRS